MRRALVLGLLGGCFAPAFPENLTCESGPQECPPGQACVGGRCRSSAGDAEPADADRFDGAQSMWRGDSPLGASGDVQSIYDDAGVVTAVIGGELYEQPAGLGWQMPVGDPMRQFVAVHGRDSFRIACGDEGLLAEANAGPWGAIGSDWTETCRGIHVEDPISVWVLIASPAHVYRRNSSGTWDSFDTGLPALATAIWGDSNGDIFVSGADEMKRSLYRFDKGNDLWVPVVSDSEPALHQIVAIGGTLEMFAVSTNAASGEILRVTTGAFVTEAVVATPLRALAAGGEQVYAAGGDRMLVRRSDESTWDVMDSPELPATVQLTAISATSDRLWVGTSAGEMFLRR